MTTPRSLTRPVTEIPPAEIPAMRAALLAEADELLTRANGDSLAGPDAETFRNIEQAIGTLDTRARMLDHEAALDNGPLAGMIAAATSSHSSGNLAAPFRPTGVMPELSRFSDEQLRQVHADFLAGRPSQHVGLNLETRDVTAVPMATVPGQRVDPVTIAREPTRIANLLPTEMVEAPKVTFYQQSAAASAAAVVAEGADKPESNPGWTAVTVDVRKIAHFADVSKEALEDFANFRSIVATEMNAGLINTENTQLLSGPGTGINILGLVNTVGMLTYAPGSTEARYRSIRIGVRNLRKGAGFAEADTVIVHPDDAAEFDLSNDTTAGLHAVPDLSGTPNAPMWGLRRVETTGITAGTALVMDSRRAAVLFVREAPTLYVDPYSQSSKNLVRIIAEERIALGALNPACMLKITFNTGA